MSPSLGKAASRLGFSFSELLLQEAHETNKYSGSQQRPTDAGAFFSPIAHTCSHPGASLLECEGDFLIMHLVGHHLIYFICPLFLKGFKAVFGKELDDRQEIKILHLLGVPFLK